MSMSMSDDYFVWCRYPSANEWNVIIDALFSTFPQLRSEAVGVDDVQVLVSHTALC